MGIYDKNPLRDSDSYTNIYFKIFIFKYDDNLFKKNYLIQMHQSVELRTRKIAQSIQ